MYRQFGQQGRIDHDVLTTVDDPQEGEPLIYKVIEVGKRLGFSIPLTQSREHAATQLTHLPKDLCQLREGATVEVQVSPTLRKLVEVVDAQHKFREGLTFGLTKQDAQPSYR